MHGIQWQWQIADGAMSKAPLATECAGRNPADREKKGRKRSLLVDGRGLPLSIAVSGANVHDSKLLDRTLAQIVVHVLRLRCATNSIYAWTRAMSAIQSQDRP